MFTGIIQGIGEIKNIHKYGSEQNFTIKMPAFFLTVRKETVSLLMVFA